MADSKKAADDAWNHCIFDKIARMDDGKTDPLSVAVGVSPMCASEWYAVSEAFMTGFTTEKSRDWARNEMRTNEMKLLTAAVLFYRANKGKK